MKLLALIFICSLAGAQTAYDANGAWFDAHPEQLQYFKGWIPYHQADSIRAAEFEWLLDSAEARTLRHFAGLWESYKRECWNDSTAAKGIDWYTKKRIIVHREPTLEGFMDFIRRTK
jgi:hypothetical protein